MAQREISRKCTTCPKDQMKSAIYIDWLSEWFLVALGDAGPPGLLTVGPPYLGPHSKMEARPTVFLCWATLTLVLFPPMLIKCSKDRPTGSNSSSPANFVVVVCPLV